MVDINRIEGSERSYGLDFAPCEIIQEFGHKGDPESYMEVAAWASLNIEEDPFDGEPLPYVAVGLHNYSDGIAHEIVGTPADLIALGRYLVAVGKRYAKRKRGDQYWLDRVNEWAEQDRRIAA